MFPTGAAFETYIRAVMTKRECPGLAIAVLGQGGPVYTRTFGHRGLKARMPVTVRTHFAMGSVTKSFTATVAATLVDSGTIGWDSPLRTYDPGFALPDPAAPSRNMPQSFQKRPTATDSRWKHFASAAEPLVTQPRGQRSLGRQPGKQVLARWAVGWEICKRCCGDRGAC